MSNRQCFICGAQNNLQAHHIKKVERDPDLTVDLCIKCHSAVHTRARAVDRYWSPGQLEKIDELGICAAVGLTPDFPEGVTL